MLKIICTYFTRVLRIALVSDVLNEHLASENSEISKYNAHTMLSDGIEKHHNLEKE